jgi:hypothetical protein
MDAIAKGVCKRRRLQHHNELRRQLAAEPPRPRWDGFDLTCPLTLA